MPSKLIDSFFEMLHSDDPERVFEIRQSMQQHLVSKGYRQDSNGQWYSPKEMAVNGLGFNSDGVQYVSDKIVFSTKQKENYLGFKSLQEQKKTDQEEITSLVNSATKQEQKSLL